MVDGNEAAAYIAFKVNEFIAIYPISPSSSMGELSDEWSFRGDKNIWGTVPLIQQMQSEAGVAGAIHGALQCGTLTTTFTSSQGLLLMIPNMYKIAGELMPVVFHVAARSLAAQALSIFGDHSDVMAARPTGFAMLASSSVQEAMDFALISHVATLESRVPFIHFFDGFRTSHEIAKIEAISEVDILTMMDEKLVLEHRNRCLSPDHPTMRGSTHNPDIYFQARETVNPYYVACPDIVQKTMDKFSFLTGRHYKLFEYYGDPKAERVMIIMGSGAQACQDTVDKLRKTSEKVGVLKVGLYRPFSIKHFIAALPKTAQVIAVLDRTKEPGSIGEPLYLDVVSAVMEDSVRKKNKFEPTFKRLPRIIGGRFGLSSKEFTPAMIKGIFDEMKKENPKNHFTVGINDDVSHTSLNYDENFIIESDAGLRAIFYGLGSDGTVGANKNTIKIIGESTPMYAQGYFVYDSKKSGSITISHLRFGPKPIRSSYLISKANFLACHQFEFVNKIDMLKNLDNNGVFLLNSHYGADEVWDKLPGSVQEEIIARKARFFVIDAYKLVHENKGIRINTIMQTCFFAISGILPQDEAIQLVKSYIRKTYDRKGEEIVKMNERAVDHSIEHLKEVIYPKKVTNPLEIKSLVPEYAPEFVCNVVAKIMAGKGDEVPVSALPADGTYPVGTTKWEKRNIAEEIPVWDTDLCIQCSKCVMVCPHSAIRVKVFQPDQAKGAPETFKFTNAREREWQGLNLSIQVAPEDCTGCALCVEVCPVKSKTDPEYKALNMKDQAPLREPEVANWDFFTKIPELDRNLVKKNSVRTVEVLQPLFEFSGACSGCGETPYIKLTTQLFGDRMLVANATGCSSIYGGNLPTTPWTKNSQGRGPAWANSLFEDNAEFGMGMRLALDKQKEYALELLKKLSGYLPAKLVNAIIENPQKDEPEIAEQREYVNELRKELQRLDTMQSQQLNTLADMLVKKSVWIIGGDGWAYDIGFGGLDHVFASGPNVNILVLDTEVYSNTGGQASKSTPRAAVARFAAGGKKSAKKDLALMAMTYRHVYVASVAFGAKDEHTLRAFLEAEAYDGPSLIIAYSHCIAHGIDMSKALQSQREAVLSGYWPLFRFHPKLFKEGKNPLILDSAPSKMEFKDFAAKQNRFHAPNKTSLLASENLLEQAQQDIAERWRIYSAIAEALEKDRGEVRPEELARIITGTASTSEK